MPPNRALTASVLSQTGAENEAMGIFLEILEWFDETGEERQNFAVWTLRGLSEAGVRSASYGQEDGESGPAMRNCLETKPSTCE